MHAKYKLFQLSWTFTSHNNQWEIVKASEIENYSILDSKSDIRTPSRGLNKNRNAYTVLEKHQLP